MFVESLRIRGFKSLADVTLDHLDKINVFHGRNDVGKSNILQALDLFFQLALPAVRSIADEERGLNLKYEFLQPYTPGVFRQDGDRQIVWEARLRAPDAKQRLNLQLTLVDEPGDGRHGRGGLRLFLDWNWGKAGDRDAAAKELAAKKLLQMWEDPANDFNLVAAERRFAREWLGDEIAPVDYAPYERHGSPVEPQRLKQVLLEAARHPDMAQRRRFEQLAQLLDRRFGVGELDVAWDAPREAPRLRPDEPLRYVRDILVRFLREDFPAPLALEDVGSGVQQLVLLLGQMLFNPARLVGVEEPEMNLSSDWQALLMAVFRDLVAPGAGGLDQIFITSHSPCFEFQNCFYLVTYEAEAQATRVARFPLEKRADLFGPQQPLGEQRGQRLNSQNQVTLYREVVKDLDLKYGDIVYFNKNAAGRWELQPEDEALGELREALDDIDAG